MSLRNNATYLRTELVVLVVIRLCRIELFKVYLEEYINI